MSFDVLWSSAKSTFILFLETPVHKHYTKVRANVFDGRCHHTCQWMTIGLYWSLKLYSLMFQHVSTPLQVTSGGRIISGKRFVRASQNRSSRSWHLQHQQTQRCFNLKETFVRSQHLSKWFNFKKNVFAWAWAGMVWQTDMLQALLIGTSQRIPRLLQWSPTWSTIPQMFEWQM